MSDGEYDDEYEELTAEEKLAIAGHYVGLAPPGEVKFVVEDVSQLLDDKKVTSDEAMAKIMRTYNHKNFVVIDGVMLSPYAEVKAGLYYDPIKDRTVAVDHLKQKVTDSGETLKPEASTTASELRDAVQEAANAYLKKSFKSSKSSTAAFAKGDKVQLAISGVNSKLAAFWSGGWISEYVVDTSGSGDVAGKINVRVHIFEFGNVQLTSKKKQNFSIDLSQGAKGAAKALLKKISALESDYQAEMEEMFISMNKDTFKKMRRILPVTGNKMNWLAAAHNVANEIQR